MSLSRENVTTQIPICILHIRRDIFFPLRMVMFVHASSKKKKKKLKSDN